MLSAHHGSAMPAARGRSKSRDKSFGKGKSEPEWKHWKGFWWWRDVHSEANPKPWKLASDFDAEAWKAAVAKAEEEERQKHSHAAVQEKKQLSSAREAAMAAVRAWGHGDARAAALIREVDQQFDKKRSVLEPEARMEATRKELGNQDKKLADLGDEAVRIRDRLKTIEAEAAYVTARRDQLRQLFAQVEQQLIEEAPTDVEDGSAGMEDTGDGDGGQPHSSRSQAPYGQPAPAASRVEAELRAATEANNNRCQQMEASMMALSARMEAFMNAIAPQTATPAPTPPPQVLPPGQTTMFQYLGQQQQQALPAVPPDGSGEL